MSGGAAKSRQEVVVTAGADVDGGICLVSEQERTL
jgi:hypothetical protein